MSAREELHAAVCAALGEVLAPVAVFDAPPVRGGVPCVVVEEPILIDWSTKDFAGREGRIAVLIRDEGERPVRLRAMTALTEYTIEAMPAALGGGWRIVTLTMLRSRILRSAAGWTGMSEFRVRMLRTN